MTPREQLARSHVWVGPLLTIIPVDGEFALFHQTGGTRELIIIGTPEQLTTEAERMFREAELHWAKTRADEAAKRATLPEFTADSLNLSGFTL
jgi:hypothetical protein